MRVLRGGGGGNCQTRRLSNTNWPVEGVIMFLEKREGVLLTVVAFLTLTCSGLCVSHSAFFFVGGFLGFPLLHPPSFSTSLSLLITLSSEVPQDASLFFCCLDHLRAIFAFKLGFRSCSLNARCRLVTANLDENDFGGGTLNKKNMIYFVFLFDYQCVILTALLSRIAALQGMSHLST